MVRRASGRAISVVVLALTAVVATLLVSVTASTSLLGVPAHPRDPRPPGTGGHLGHRSPPPVPAIPEWLRTVLLVVLLIGVIALVWFARKARKPYQARLLFEEDEQPSDTGSWEARVITELGAAAAAEQDRLRHGDPRNAIVACWMHLQETTARAGLPPHSAETSTEFTVRALRRLRVDETAIRTLSQLYREARFSQHQMGEPERARAIEAVGVLAAGIDTRLPGSGFGPGRRATVDSVTP